MPVATDIAEPLPGAHRLSQWSSTQTSIDSLPIEILNEIFTHTLEFSFYKRQRLLSSVSPKWRDVVRSCPQLWTEISLDIENLHPPILYLGLCLERSQNLLINIRIEEGVREADPVPLDVLVPYLDRVGVVLSRHMDRFKTLYINRLSLDSLIGRFLTALPFAEARRLEKIDSTMLCDPAGRVTPALGKTPALRRLRCRWWGELQPLTYFPLQQLTYLELSSSLSWEEITQLLALCTSLVTLHLSSRSAVDPLTLPKSIPLPNLKGFTVAGPCAVYLMLPMFDCPNLRAFCLRCENDSLSEQLLHLYSPLFQFLGGGNHSLRYFRLCDSSFPMALLRRFFAIPRLAEIDFFDFFYDLSSRNTMATRIEDDLPENDLKTIERNLKEIVESSSNPNVQDLVWSIQPRRYIKIGWAKIEKLRDVLFSDAIAFHNVVNWAELGDYNGL